MIPKIIHYCWFGGREMPDNLKKCLESWEKFMPNYQWMRWDETNFDVNILLWTKQAYSSRKYAFVSDYVRLKALYEYGGIYLDTDVMLLKSLDELRVYEAFTGFEGQTKLTSAVIGAEKEFPIIKEFMQYYQCRSFFYDDGTENKEANVVMMTEICKKYGLITNNTEQTIQGMHIFPKTYFCPLDFYMNKDFSDNTYAIHYFDASWLDEETKKQINKERSNTYKIKMAVLSLASRVYHQIKGDKQ